MNNQNRFNFFLCILVFIDIIAGFSVYPGLLNYPYVHL